MTQPMPTEMVVEPAPEPGLASRLVAEPVYREFRGGHAPRICILALSPIVDDPRVRRQADAFYDAGWRVTALGLPGGCSPEPRWPILTRDSLATPEPGGPETAAGPPPATIKSVLIQAYRDANRFFPVSQQVWDRFERLLKHVWSRGEYMLLYGRMAAGGLRAGFTRLAGRFSARRQEAPPRKLSEEAVVQRFWSMSSNILDIYACGQTVEADVWLANDWTALPIAARLAREKGGIYGYDTHEFATEEYAESTSWRLLQRPFVLALEGQFIAGAAITSAVSSGIAERLDQLYGLSRPTLTIRNMPVYEPVAFRPTDPDRITVLYHGLVSPNRGIEAAIDAVALWRPEFTLTIRGPGDAA
jgi:glycosyltransferase involved in cell wall biosynthesis